MRNIFPVLIACSLIAVSTLPALAEESLLLAIGKVLSQRVVFGADGLEVPPGASNADKRIVVDYYIGPSLRISGGYLDTLVVRQVVTSGESDISALVRWEYRF